VFFAAQSLTIASAGLLGAALANRPSGLPDLFFTALMLNVTAVGLLLFIKPPQIVGADPQNDLQELDRCQHHLRVPIPLVALHATVGSPSEDVLGLNSPAAVVKDADGRVGAKSGHNLFGKTDDLFGTTGQRRHSALLSRRAKELKMS